jgi:hypothetical protein
MVQNMLFNARVNETLRTEAALLTIGKGPKLPFRLDKRRPIWGKRRIYAPPKYLPRVEDMKHANQKKKETPCDPLLNIPPFLDRRSKS